MMRNLIISVSLLALTSEAWAACTSSGTTLTAASAGSTDVQACFTAATSTTTLITIPLGTAHWTSALSFTVPSGSANLATPSCDGSSQKRSTVK